MHFKNNTMDEHIENNIQTAISKKPSPKTAKSFGSLLRRFGDRIPMHFETMQNPSLSFSSVPVDSLFFG